MAAESPGDAWAAIWEANVWADTVWEGGPSSGGIGPTPDVTDDSRRRLGMLVIRGGVGRRGGR